MLDSVGQMGHRRSGSAVYLGKKWIVTAYHAFEGRSSNVVIFSGKEYALIPKGAVRLQNPNGSGLAAQTDLIIVPLRTAPDLPALKVNEMTPFAGEKVVLVGYGESAPRYEFPLTAVPDGSVITPLPISDPSVRKAAPATGVSWGENEVSERGVAVGTPNHSGQTRAFVTIRQPDGQTFNAQGASGDSGGGVFVKRGERWELSGVMLSVIHREDLNASGTFIADLSVYREQIEAAIPEPSALALLGVAGVFGCLRRRRR